MNNLTAYDFWGEPTWIGGSDEDRCKRLRAYEKTGMEPEKIAKLKLERNAAMKDLRMSVGAPPEEGCVTCKHLYDICEDCYWEWRGVCAENTEVANNEQHD